MQFFPTRRHKTRSLGFHYLHTKSSCVKFVIACYFHLQSLEDYSRHTEPVSSAGNSHPTIPRTLTNVSGTTFPYCKWRKVGQGLGMRLGYIVHQFYQKCLVLCCSGHRGHHIQNITKQSLKCQQSTRVYLFTRCRFSSSFLFPISTKCVKYCPGIGMSTW